MPALARFKTAHAELMRAYVSAVATASHVRRTFRSSSQRPWSFQGAMSDPMATADLLAMVQRLYPFEAADLTYDKLLGVLRRMGAVHRALRIMPVLEYDAVGDRLHVVDPLARLFLTSTNRQALVADLPDRGRDIKLDKGKVFQAEFDERVLALYGKVCAVCPITRPELITVVRLSRPPWLHAKSPGYGLPLCRSHAQAFKKDLLAFEPETTKIVCIDPVGSNIVRQDLSHLPARPTRSALEDAWRKSGWRLSMIWGDSQTEMD
jgi:hypothetical protein